MLDFRIDTFITVCKYYNFTKAAEELNVTQPAVSQHIKYLEKHYQCKLFIYQGKKMHLSEEGEFLLNFVTTMKHDDIYLKEKIAQKKNKKQRLIFGATLTASEFLLPLHLAEFMKRHEKSEIKMIVGNTKDLLFKINQGEIDFAFIEGYFPKKEFDSLPYSEESYVALCSPTHQFNTSVHTVEDLLNENIIIREQGSGTREIFEKFIGEKNLRLEDFHQVSEIGNLKVIKTLVEKDCGISFLYEAAITDEIKKKRLALIPLEDFHITHRIYFIWRKNSVFSSYYQNIYKEFSPFSKDDTQ